MRILLVKPPFARLLGSRVYQTLPLGLMYVAAMLQSRGHEVRVYHDDISNPEPLPGGAAPLGQVRSYPLLSRMWVPFTDVLDEWRPEVVGFGYCTADREAAVVFAGLAKERGIRTVAGGIHPSLLPGEELQVFDAVVVGEGDDERAAAAFEDRGTGLIVYCRQEDLDRYQPARDAVIGGKRYPPFLRGLIQTQRGCPYHCAYCAAPEVFGTKVRVRDAGLVREEVEGLGVSLGRIVDDSFGANRPHALAVCKELANTNYRWICDAALQNVDEELVAGLAEGGCIKVCMGVESASARWRELSGKHVKEGEPEAALALLTRYGIAAVFYFMLGFPGETVAEMRGTIAYARELKRVGAEPCLSIVTAYPRTRLWEMVPEERRPGDWSAYCHQNGRMGFGDCRGEEWKTILEEAQNV